MSQPIPPEIQAQIAAGVGWLWSQYGQKALEKITGRAVDEAKWLWSIEKYYTSLYERVGFVRVLGRMEAEPLENVFTHVNVLDKLTAERRYDIARLKAESDPRDFTWTERVKRLAGDEAVAEYDKLFILGKPGAGKTTFLKHTALRAIKREIKKIPVFVTLKELSDSGMAIEPFITHQFQVHRFPDPAAFVERLLQDGHAIVLLDGLDEVNLEDNRRAAMIQQLNDFVYRYGDCPMLLTCRVAATDYSFTQFEYVEMADFDAEQMGRYIDQWFVYDDVKRVNCRKALLEDDANKGVRELAQVPLLLALLCLVYEERNEFPPNRDEIYDEATRALLVKWDSSRNITRDTVYQQLSLKHKQKMLSHIAAATFTDGDYFLPETRVVGLIETYLQGVPGLEEPDGELVLKAMEAQHGIFVERAQRIHSFSHLTLQEYFTARYIVENERRGAVERMMQYVGDDRWNEVFLLVAGMLDDATEFAELYMAAAAKLAANDEHLVALLQWAVQKGMRMLVDYGPAAVRAFLQHLALALAHDPDHEIALDYASAIGLTYTLAHTLNHTLALALVLVDARDHDFGRGIDRTLTLALKVAEKLNHEAFRSDLATLSVPEDDDDKEAWRRFAGQLAVVLAKYRDDWDPYRQMPITKEEAAAYAALSEDQTAAFNRYLEANLLLARCLQVTYVPDRAAIENQILLPP